jgi:hypothetical protein
MRPKAVSRLVVIGCARIIVEYPASVLCAAGFVDEPTDLVLVVVPKPADHAILAVLVPKLRVDVPCAVKWRHKLIPVVR